MNNFAIILAAGKGTRMKSDKLKVAHKIAGKPIVSYVVDAAFAAGVKKAFVVVGHQAELLKETLDHSELQFVTQKEQLGTGHAVMQVALEWQPEEGDTVVVLAGDCPLIKPQTLRDLVAMHHESNAIATVLTTNMEDPAGYGRIIRGGMGTLMEIVEAKDCTPDQLKIKEINTGTYVFDAQALFNRLSQIRTDNSQQEYYLTDMIHILKEEGLVVSAYCLADSTQAIGVNTRQDIASTHEALYQEKNRALMQEGVTIIDPKTTKIDSIVEVGVDTIIYPFTCIYGASKIGSQCEIGSFSYLEDITLQDKEKIAPGTQYYPGSVKNV